MSADLKILRSIFLKLWQHLLQSLLEKRKAVNRFRERQSVVQANIEVASFHNEPRMVRVPLKTVDGILVLQPNL